jgi:hypothetical protein
MHDRLDDLFKAVDAKDTDLFLGFLTDQASFRFGSAPPAQGKANRASLFVRARSRIRGMTRQR